jgi:YHS domain-containing protein
MFTVETDGVFLVLNCYKGGSEKNEAVLIERFSPIEKKIMNVIDDTIGHSMVTDLRKDTKRMSDYVRKYYKVPFPEVNELLVLDEEIEKNGYSVYEDILVLEYLENKEIPFVTFEYEGKKYVFTSKNKLDEFQEVLMKEVTKKKNEIKQIQDLEMDIFYKSKRIFG